MSGLYRTVTQKINEDLAIIEANELMKSGDKAFRAVAKISAALLTLVVLAFWIPSLLKYSGTLANAGPLPWLYRALQVDISKWGQFGDFIGGLLNPAVGLTTIYLILINVRLQKRELSLALQEMKNSNSSLVAQNAAIEVQNFQNTFFNWLSSYREITLSATFITREKTIVGSPAFQFTYDIEFNPTNIYNAFVNDSIPHFTKFHEGKFDLGEYEEQKIESCLLNKWSGLRSRNYAIGSSIKSLTGLTKWMMERAPTSKTKYEYFGILLSQLSQIELAFVLYETSRTNQVLLRNLNEIAFFDSLSAIDDDQALAFIKNRLEKAC